MASYTPLPSGSGPSPSSPRRSVSFRDRFSTHGRRRSQAPDPAEMDRAFDDPGDDDPGDDDEHDAHEEHHLLGNASPSSPQRAAPMPGDYDFDRDYFLPPLGSPPPFEDYSATNPAPGNSNGVLSTEPVTRPKARHFLGGILPLSFLPRKLAAAPAIGGGQSGVFSNLSARPDGQPDRDTDDPNFANEETQKDAPPSYQTALRDAVPPYWDTTVVLPSSQSPFGPLSSSINGDEILIDGMGAGNLFGFFWNLTVSVSFQFVGFLLTYVLHTTHAAKFGSRAGLGVTLVGYGYKLYLKAKEFIAFEGDDEIDPITGKTKADMETEKEYTGRIMWPQSYSVPFEWGGNGEVLTVHNFDEAAQIAHKFNHTLGDIIGEPSAADVGRANEYFAFMLMAIGWFLILASLGGWWRVKRFEYKLKEAQRESEAAQRAARGSTDDLHPEEDDDSTPTGSEPGPTEWSYYSSAFTQAYNGAREIQRGFFGMRGQPIERGDVMFNSNEDEHELLAAQGYGLEPMASPTHTRRDSDSRRRGLWN